MTLERLSLSRSSLDRAAERRTEPGLAEKLLADPATRVLRLDGGQAPIEEAGDGPRLVLAPGGEPAPDAIPLFLGMDSEGVAYVALLRPTVPPPAEEQPEPGPPLPPGARLAGLREVGQLLGDRDAGLLTAAVALSFWHAGHPVCSRCGSPTDVTHAGWQRHCPDCGADHFPRTDPAVIMAVISPDDRILLGRQNVWPQGRYSTLAGFVEPGESLEAAVRREVGEEAGVAVGAVVYRGSQPWPFPSSLMLGFRAEATSTEIDVDGDELADARWWSREQLAADIAAGTLLLPPGVSIARRLIEEWYGEEITDAQEAWR